METNIYLVTGFIKSGKTSLINELISSKMISSNNILVIQNEFGEEKIASEKIYDEKEATSNNEKKISVFELESKNNLNKELLYKLIEKYEAESVIIELNGLVHISSILNEIENAEINSKDKKITFKKIINIIDIENFESHQKNFTDIFNQNIIQGDLIVLNKIESTDKKQFKTYKKSIKSLNKSAEILEMSSNKDESETHEELKKINLKKTLKVIAGSITLYILILAFFSVDIINLYNKILVFNTIFLSILIQAFPFIFIGILISSTIQVLVPNEKLINFFPKNKPLGFLVAIFSGVLFPICDCAIVPIASRLIKKGVPVPTAITFMLSAPLVNVIVISSTFYAFPNNPKIAIYRVIFGLIITISVGIILCFMNTKNLLINENFDKSSCNCGCCGTNIPEKTNLKEKFHSIFKHSSEEFFSVGKFLIIGAFLSGLLQTLVPKSIFNNLADNTLLSLLIMMIFAFVFSVCSTSDAFIGKSFLNQFSINSVMGFLILGPMIDVKNMLMLLSSFNKKFVIKLISIIFVISFIILSILNNIFL